MKENFEFNNLILNLTIFYFLTASLLAVFRGFSFSFMQFALAFVLFVILLLKKRILKGWMPLVLVLISYEFLDGLIPVTGAKVNIYAMPNFDLALFGNILNIKLQNALFNQYQYRWYDYFSVILYSAHIMIPVIAGVLFWMKNKNVYRQYIFSFVIVSYVSFITYILYPAMPPWFASELGLIPNVYEIIGKIASSYNHPMFFSHIYDYGGVNINAAMPSLHASYPFLILLFFAKYYKKYFIVPFLYTVGIWFAVIYLGSHYILDVIVGVFYTAAIFILVDYFYQRKFLLAEEKIQK